jgi:hypothetical protein
MNREHDTESSPLNEALPPAEDRLGMTAEQWRCFQDYTHGFGEQDAAGVDLSLLRANLRLTPTERVKRMLRFHDVIRELHRAGTAARCREDPADT